MQIQISCLAISRPQYILSHYLFKIYDFDFDIFVKYIFRIIAGIGRVIGAPDEHLDRTGAGETK